MSDRDHTSNVLSFPAAPPQACSVELVPFRDAKIIVISDQHGEHWVPLTPLFEANLGVDANGQRQRIERQPWAEGWTCVIHAQLPGDGQSRKHLCIHYKRLAMALATVEALRFKDEAVRRRIVDYQNEAADALDSYFRKGIAVRGSEAIHTTPVRPVDNFGRIEEWVEMRRKQELTGASVVHLINDNARLHTRTQELDEKYTTLCEATERLELELHRNQPSPAQREEMVRAIKEACECRITDRERLLLLHVASEGPATSQRRMGAAAGVTQKTALATINSLAERSMLDFAQRDPNLPSPRNYFVLVESLSWHAKDCAKESTRKAEAEAAEMAFSRASLERCLEMTSDTPQVVANGPPAPPPPPPMPQPAPAPLPCMQPQLGLQKVQEAVRQSADDADGYMPGPAKTERELFNAYCRKYAYDNELNYRDVFARVYALLAYEGKECRHRQSRGKPMPKIEYCELKGWCGRALEIAQREFPMGPVDRPSDGWAPRGKDLQ